MSETAPEQPPRSGGNILTRPIGPLPLWAWLVIGTAVILGYSYWKNRQSASNTSNSGASSGTTDTANIPQFVNQVYTNPSPPATTSPTATPQPNQNQKVPNVPTELSATPYDTYAHFGWSALPGTSDYRIKVYTVKGNKQILDTTTKSLNYDLQGLAPGTEYKWQLQDPGTGGSSQWMTFATKPKASSKPAGKTGGGNPPHVGKV